MASIMDEYHDTSLENESEDIFTCKACGEILEEGKAFELAGYRWHINCFRCHTCATLLDTDANLLLLGDGSLICNNCTYSCNACGNKIEDLAILTGDQAFCSTCFRCRNCKRKIENLRYARTSQGIFCMGCHETLMARRRKKSKAAAAAKSREKEQQQQQQQQQQAPPLQSPMMTEKSLPALPPNEIPKNAFSNDRVDPDSDYGPGELSPRPHDNDRHDITLSRSSSRAAPSPEPEPKPEGLGLTAPSYRNNRRSMVISGEFTNGDDGFFIPVVLDPSPGPSSSAANSEKKKDHFNVPKSSFASKHSDSPSSTPHTAFQEKGRQHSYESDTKPLARAPSTTQEYNSSGSPKDEQPQIQETSSKRDTMISSSSSSYSPQQNNSTQSLQEPPHQDDVVSTSRGWDETKRHDQDDAHSLTDKPRSITRKELPTTFPKNTPARDSSEKIPPPKPPRPMISTSVADQKKPLGSFTQPRTGNSGSRDGKTSPKLPRWSNGGDFSMSMDEDMARILGTDEGSSSILRRTSNMVRHGRTTSIEQVQTPSRASHTRSISETTRGTASPQWSKNTSVDERTGRMPDVLSPLSPPADDPVLLRRQLRTSEQRVAELERRFSTKSDLRNLNKKLMEKKKTVSVLDTQTEIMIKQLEVLAKYVEKAKDTKTRVDPRELEDSIIKDFVQKLEQVRIQMSGEIEQLHQERDQLIEEKEQAQADRDRALMEFEQLSTKNAQLADMNNEMAHQLQGRYKNGGLGIYGDRTGAASSINLDAASMSTGQTLVVDDDHIVESGPTVVQVRKGQAKKFNWKKGSKGLAQSVAKGVNRAAGAFQQNDRGERIHNTTLQGDNIGMPYNAMVVPTEHHAPLTPAALGKHADQHRQGFGFFSKKNAMPKSTSSVSAVASPMGPELPSTLFGSDLTERADYERRQIPSIVTRCIEEVELRGMDQEGIYRKTGGNSQINAIKDGFDRSENFDISDPDLDITAVTSVLKQYFRKLPTPLLTYDVYDRVLESTSIINEAERCEHLGKTFASMPEKHRDCLEFLMFHLGRVAQRQGENLMTSKNLAVVFAPTIMFDHNIEREMTDMHAKNLAVQFVIENGRAIFGES